jgi:predicted naringenin-chalcone synthase
LSKIISIGTATPSFKHKQSDILQFMQLVYAMDTTENRKLKFLYHQSGIDWRYSVISDYSREISDWKFYPQTENIEPFPPLEKRMQWFQKYAPVLSVAAIRNCLDGISEKEITHLITVSCTGMSAPGLELQVMELLDLPKNIFRSSVNFMGCYAAIHALKIADAICAKDNLAKVMIVCTELCTLHFQKETTTDSIASSLLFGDGAAAALVTPDDDKRKGLKLESFYSEVLSKGKQDMAWELSSTGFLMTLSGYVPELIEEDFSPLVTRALEKSFVKKEEIKHWCIHPGGRRILDAIHRSLELKNGDLDPCYSVLKNFGNMSSATILFVLKDILQKSLSTGDKIFTAAFGPGLTMETFIGSPNA